MTQISFRIIKPFALFMFAVLTYFSLSAAFAAELPILEITNEEDRDTMVFSLKTDVDNILITGFLKDTFSRKGKKIGRQEFDLEDIYKDGMILEQRKERIIAKLVSDNFDPKHGGDIIIDTLYNGASGKRKQYDIQLVHNTKAWVLTSKGKEVNHMHMKSKKIFLIGTVGIANLIMSKK
jgi:hypothetical protein